VSTVIEVATPHGPAIAHLDGDWDRDGTGGAYLLVLGHGAGGGVEAPDLRAVRDAAVAHGATVARVEQPYRVAGRRAPPPAAQLDQAWTAAVAAVARHVAAGADPPRLLVVGGRSSGARVACRTAGDTGAVAVIALAFPFVPPQRPGRGRPRGGEPRPSRASELEQVRVPVLVVQGERDPFGIPAARGHVELAVVPGDHSLRTASASIGALVANWIARQVGANRVSAHRVSGPRSAPAQPR